MKSLSLGERRGSDWFPQNKPLDQMDLRNHHAPQLCVLWVLINHSVISLLHCLRSFAANAVNAGFPCGSIIDPFLFSLDKRDLPVLSWFQLLFHLPSLYISSIGLPQTYVFNFLLTYTWMPSYWHLKLNMPQNKFNFPHLPRPCVSQRMSPPFFL